MTGGLEGFGGLGSVDGVDPILRRLDLQTNN